MPDKSSLRHHAIATSHVSAALSQKKESLREKVTLDRYCIYKYMCSINVKERKLKVAHLTQILILEQAHVPTDVYDV